MEDAAKAVYLKEMLNSVQTQFLAAYNFTVTEATLVKRNFDRLYQYCSDKIGSVDLVNAVKRGGSRSVENFKAALSFLNNTYQRNAHSLEKTRRETTGFLSSFVRKNRQLLSFMKAENKKLVSTYASRVDVEMFYTPEDSVCLVQKVRDVTDLLAGRNRTEEVFVAQDVQDSE